MAERKPLDLLVVGYGNGDITFIDQLIRGLTQKSIRVTIASSSKESLNHIGPGMAKWLWAPSWNVNLSRRLAALVWLMVSHFQLHKPNWFSNLIASEERWRSRLEVVYRYLPFTQKKWDVVYFPWNSAAIDYAGLFDAGIPVVISCRGSQVNVRPYLKGQETYTSRLRETLTQADAVHCVSQDILEQARLYGLDEDKAVIIHPAVDTDLFKPVERNDSKETLRLVTTGSLIWSKGYEYLITALSLLSETDVKAELHIIGEGYERSHILFSAQDLGVQEKVFLHGKLTPEQVRDQLQRADIFVFASLSEGLPNAVLEAMSCGLPVVTSDCGGVSEAVTDGVEGFVVPVREPVLMAEALYTLAQDPVLRKRMGAAGRERVLTDFRLDDQVDHFITLFNSLVREDEHS